ncbi:hypothetical protein [Undibacterium flavidum]|uniref:LTXXQ motif family protein n=1 Tax=Undibacterium flavidum TaxID=2762297 RepID=A0ABR6Y866_9BURK|nr:hypothetical protein [Undibacterium flavidum]MBC3872808.1 hypothetical protein [Undibacterium flavidum]
MFGKLLPRLQSLPSTKKMTMASLWGLLMAGMLIGVNAQAIDIWEFRAQDVLPILGEFKNNANFTSNQQGLWLQMEARTKAMLRVREDRRHEIQLSIKKRLQTKAPELRDLAQLMDQDDTLSARENQELRECWMTMYDALSDVQRDALAVLMNEQLMRVADKPKEAQHGGEKNSGGAHRSGKGGMGGGRPGVN